MSLLEDAQLLRDGLDYDIYPCPVCLREPPDGHHPDCACLSLPRIVAALEAGQRVASGPCPTYWEWEAPVLVPEGYGGGAVLKCAHCRQKLHAHAPDCPWPALVGVPNA